MTRSMILLTCMLANLLVCESSHQVGTDVGQPQLVGQSWKGPDNNRLEITWSYEYDLDPQVDGFEISLIPRDRGAHRSPSIVILAGVTNRTITGVTNRTTNMTITTPLLVRGEQYTIRITAISVARGNATYTGYILIPPAAPTITGIDPCDEKFTVFFNSGSGFADLFFVALERYDELPTPQNYTERKVYSYNKPSTKIENFRAVLTKLVPGYYKAQVQAVGILDRTYIVGPYQWSQLSQTGTVKLIAPNITSATPMTSKVQLTWVTTNVVNYTSFTVSMVPAPSRSGRSSHVTGTRDITVTVGGNLRVTEISGLPGETYTISMISTFGDHDSRSSKPVDITLGFAPPRIITASSTIRSSVHMTWESDTPSSFLITMLPNSPGGSAVVQSTSADVRELEILAVAGEMYNISMISIVGNVESDRSGTIVVIVPLIVPVIQKHIYDVRQGEVHLNVIWQHAGLVKWFVVTFYTSTTGGFSKEVTVTSSQRNLPSAVPTGQLEQVSGVQYFVTVTAIAHSYGESSVSPIYRIVIPPSPPSNIHAQVNITAGHVFISWTKVGTASRFDLLFLPRNGDNISSYSNHTSVIIPIGIAEYDLAKGQVYRLSITATSHGKTSQSVSLELMIAPNAPVITLGTYAVGKDDIYLIVEWEHTGLVEQFNITFTLSTNGGFKSQMNIPNNNSRSLPNPTTVGLLQLVHGAQYYVSVIAISHGGTSPSRLHVIAIPPAPPNSIQTQVDITAGYILVSWAKEGNASSFALLFVPDSGDNVTSQSLDTSVKVPIGTNVNELREGKEYNLTINATSYGITSQPASKVLLIVAPGVSMTLINRTSRSLTIQNTWESPEYEHLEITVDVNNVMCVMQVDLETGLHSTTSECIIAIAESAIVPTNSSLTITLIDLLPDREYVISVTPYSNSSTSEDERTYSTMAYTTLEEVPPELNLTSVTPKSTTSLEVCWEKPEPRPGITTYIITIIVYTETGDVSEQDTVVYRREKVDGYNNTCAEIEDLDQTFPYIVEISAHTGVGLGPTTRYATPTQSTPIVHVSMCGSASSQEVETMLLSTPLYPTSAGTEQEQCQCNLSVEQGASMILHIVSFHLSGEEPLCLSEQLQLVYQTPSGKRAPEWCGQLEHVTVPVDSSSLTMQYTRSGGDIGRGAEFLVRGVASVGTPSVTISCRRSQEMVEGANVGSTMEESGENNVPC